MPPLDGTVGQAEREWVIGFCFAMNARYSAEENPLLTLAIVACNVPVERVGGPGDPAGKGELAG